MKVSFVTPTYNRQPFHKGLYEIFVSQTHADKELLVLDDSPEASTFFGALSDARVRYVHLRERMTMGQKRNWLVREAAGEVILHFDDDDYYAPAYAERMLQKLGRNDLVKLSAWFAYSVQHGFFGYWDTARAMPLHYRVFPGEEITPCRINPTDGTSIENRYLWGFGFSYVYTKALASRVAFDDSKHGGEDGAFARSAVAGGHKVSAFPDEEGLALKLHHATNISGIFPQYKLPIFLLTTIFGPRVAPFCRAPEAPAAS